MKETATSWWRQLAPRERRLISWGGAALMAALCYAYLWQPITAERHRLRANLPELRKNAAQMQHQAEEAIQLKTTSAPSPRGEAIKSAIYQASNEVGLDNKILQSNQLDEGRASISLASISFDAWIALVTNLQKNQRIRLESCVIEALPETSMVSVRAIVTTGI